MFNKLKIKHLIMVLIKLVEIIKLKTFNLTNSITLKYYNDIQSLEIFSQNTIFNKSVSIPKI